MNALVAGLYHTESDVVMVIIEDWATCPRVRHVFQFPHTEQALTLNSISLFTHISKRFVVGKSSTKFWQKRKKVICSWAIQTYERYSLFVPDDLTMPEQMHFAHTKIMERDQHCPFEDFWDMYHQGADTELRSVERRQILPYWQVLTSWKRRFSPLPSLAIHPVPPLFADDLDGFVAPAQTLIEQRCQQCDNEREHTPALVHAASVALALGNKLRSMGSSMSAARKPHAYGL
ncbi:hypothetical protein FM042_08965 [Aliidiomarina halalkaliphila]|uniref:Uncharacterized protein n=1 Tax=Aliidiomarina halalkaliphila TaxID=2593535 RepID=A0A552WZW8_9GAMM|nr:hypothetical protein [Aliidiomarina halalkaliphila]TRW48304.1 hypothetical protein FM042_08965 [Aliidiomarina halalkaliphila]